MLVFQIHCTPVAAVLLFQMASEMKRISSENKMMLNVENHSVILLTN
jgi:hypothetical protein